MVFGFLCPCVSVLPWPSPLYWFLQRCSVLTVPVLGLTLAVTPLLISTRVFGFLCPCIGSYLGRNLSLDFYKDVQFSLYLCWHLTLAVTPLVTIPTTLFGFPCPSVKPYLGCHPSYWFVLSLLLGSYLGCHPSCDDFYNGVRFSLSLCWGLTLAVTPLVTISTHWVVQTSSSKPLTFLPCIFIVSGSADDKILWATSSSWNSTRCSKNINHQISV